MIEFLPRKNTPAWLSRLTVESIQRSPFPLREILRNSLYYPSSGFDGDPVKHLAGNILSFVYVDYGVDRDAFDIALRDRGFLGYEILATREVTERELTPNGWRPSLPLRSDGVPPNPVGQYDKAFCRWVVMERQSGMPISHGPERFSLLYLCADGAAAFQALYEANGVTPKAVAIIQPGHGFGGNWTDFTDPRGILARSILGNPVGQPELLLCGGYGRRDYYREPCWPEYRDMLCFLEKSGGGSIGVWKRPLLQG